MKEPTIEVTREELIKLTERIIDKWDKYKQERKVEHNPYKEIYNLWKEKGGM